jgi:hypothetical protein
MSLSVITATAAHATTFSGTSADGCPHAIEWAVETISATDAPKTANQRVRTGTS